MGRPPRKSSRPTRSTQELEAAATSVAYEIQMLIYAFRELGMDEPPDPMEMGEHIAGTGTEYGGDESVYLESFLIHARSLRDFFTTAPESAHRDDVLATDFLPSPAKWTTAIGDGSSVMPRLFSEKARLDKSLAHISYERTEYARLGKTWFVREIYDELTKVWKRFLAEVPAERQGWFVFGFIEWQPE